LRGARGKKKQAEKIKAYMGVRREDKKMDAGKIYLKYFRWA